MFRRFCFCGMILVAIGLALMLSVGDASAQWLPGQSQQQYPPPQPGSQPQPQYPPPQPGYLQAPPQYPPAQSQYPPQQPGPPQQQVPFPPSQSQPAPPQPQFSSPLPSQIFQDAFGRFKVNLPQGSVPMGSTYSFGIPSAMCQVTIMTVPLDQMFQMQMQNFPNMIRQMGGNIDKEQPMEVKGRQARFVAATIKDQKSGNSMHSVNAFITGANIWIQVMGPEQNMQMLQQAFQSILGGLQF